MDKWDHKHYLVTIPTSVDKFDGELVYGQLVVSGAMVSVLHDIIRRNTTEAQRRVAEVPYNCGDNGSRSTKLDDLVTEHLRDSASRQALNDNESIVSISPVRWRGTHLFGGTAYIEYTTVPLSPWVDAHSRYKNG